MFFKDTTIEVWRLEAAVDNVSDPEYILSHTLYGGVQPFTGDEAIHAGQAMENIRDLVVFSDPYTDIKKTDELVYNGINRRVAYIQRYTNGVLDHAEVMTTDSQWVQS